MPSRPHLRPGYLVLALLACFAAACAALPPVFTGPQGTTSRLNGTVTYLQRIALSPDAIVEVSLQDVSRADAPAVVLASQTIKAQGKQAPFAYSLEFDPSAIDPRMTYSVSARITENGVLTWINTRMYPVLTRGAPTDNVEIIVERVQPS